MAPQNAIPTIDMSPLQNGSDSDRRKVAGQIDEACTDIGFFLVVGHGVLQDLITTTRQRAIDFFALSDAEKMKVERPPAKISRGYNCVGDRSLSYSMGEVAPPDIQEAFAFGPEGIERLAAQVNKTVAQMYAPNIWPQRPHDFKDVMLSHHAAMSGLASRVLSAMAIALGVNDNYFADKFDRHASVGRIIRYPAVTKPPLPGQLRAGGHTDYGCITFVRGDDTPGGLQVKPRQGDWIDVHIPPQAFVCNIGDMMMRWSNDRWVSTFHRVAVPPPDAAPSDRISLVFFTNPNPDTLVRCFESCVGSGEKYPPITSGEYYLGKLMKAGHSRLDATAEDALAKSKAREPQTAH
jgi:isopenicillin N synthase-like dioxygenase